MKFKWEWETFACNPKSLVPNSLASLLYFENVPGLSAENFPRVSILNMEIYLYSKFKLRYIAKD